MAKRPYLKIIFSFFPIMIIIPCIIFAFLGAQEVSHPLITKPIEQSKNFANSSADTRVQEVIPASQSSITIGDFKFRVVEVVFEKTAMGFVPVDMDSNDQVMFVEFELLAGSKEDFKSLEIKISDGSGRKSDAFILISNGITQMLATVTMKGVSSDYRPGEDNMTWAYVVPKGADRLFLNFPTGELVDLTSFLKSSRSADLKPGLLFWLSELNET